MADALTTITNLIQSPPGQLVAGGVLAGIVWKFFGRVESVLTDQTKLEIAVWLVGVTTAERWRSVMTVYVNAVCGSSIFSVRSILVTLATGVVAFCVPAGSLVSSLSKTTKHGESASDCKRWQRLLVVPWFSISDCCSCCSLLRPTLLGLRGM